MKPLIYLLERDISYSFQRVLCCVIVLLILSSTIVRESFADNFHSLPLHNVYLAQDGNLLQALVRRDPGIYWIDGYRMTVSKETQVCWHNEDLQFGAVLNRFAQPIASAKSVSRCDTDPPARLEKWMWLQYTAIQKFQIFFRPLMNVSATRIDIWENENDGKIAAQSFSTLAWQALCASASPHQLRYSNEDPIDVVCDWKVNGDIENLLSAIQNPSSVGHDVPVANREMSAFYVVKPFQVRHDHDFEIIDGVDARCNEYGGGCSYKRPSAQSKVREIVYAPDGSILIPDTVLAHLGNEAELAALLSYSSVAKDQGLIVRLFRVQRFTGDIWSLRYEASGRQNSDLTGAFVLNLNQQVLRLGIRQMYLAGYDIRYAPLAWSVERGKPMKGSLIIPDYRHMPWYAAYAFNYISQYYSDVDYGKLKKGEAEYAQFLGELRKADPEAFEKK